MSRPRVCLFLGILVVATQLAVAPDAGAYRVEGRPWPGGTIRYYNAARDQAWAVWKAARAWNESGAAVRFTQTSSERSADVVIRHFGGATCGSGEILGQATIGRAERAAVYVRRLDPSSTSCNQFASATAVAHELGHVLGLGHENRGCAVMNSNGGLNGPSRCRVLIFEWKCRLLTPDDVRGAVKLYGGRVAAQSGPPTCVVWRRISAPKGMRAEYRPDQLAVGLSVPRPASPEIPAFVARIARERGRTADQQSFRFLRAQGTCPTGNDVAAARRVSWQGGVGSTTTIYDRLPPPGRYCYAVWALDRVGVPSANPNTTWVTIPDR